MRWRSESTLLALIEQYNEQIAALTGRVPENTSVELNEKLLSASIELADLENELEFVREQGSASGESESCIPAPLKPLPKPNSAGVALPQPTDDV